MNTLLLGAARHCHEGLKGIADQIVLFTLKSGYSFNRATAELDYSFPYHSVHLFADSAPKEDFIALAKMLHQQRPFDAVCCFHDPDQALSLEIADALSLPIKLTPETLENVMNKDKTRAVLAAAELDFTPFSLVQDKAAVLPAVEQLGYPLIMKPHNGTASMGISIINSVDDVANALDYYEHSEQSYPAVIERFHQGPEFSVEAFSENGVHKVIAIVKKYVDSDTRVEVGHVTPAPLSEIDQLAIESYVCDAIGALGVTDGPTHTEIIFTAEGPRFIETHTRCGGDWIWDIVKLSTGVDMPSLAGRQAIGESVMDCIDNIKPSSKTAAVWFLLPDGSREGKLSLLGNLSEAQQLEGVFEVAALKDAGDTVGVLHNSFDRIARAIASSDNWEKSVEIAKTAIDTLTVNLAQK